CRDSSFLRIGCRFSPASPPYHPRFVFLFFSHDTSTTHIYTLSLHDALPICHREAWAEERIAPARAEGAARASGSGGQRRIVRPGDRKSTRLNSSHVEISYAVFCLKKKINCYSIDGRARGTARAEADHRNRSV